MVSSPVALPVARASCLTSTWLPQNRAPDLRPHELAITVWAYSKAQERPPPSMLEAVGRQAAKKAAFFGPNELAIAAWGFAAMTCRPPPEVFPAFSREVSRLVGEMSGQNVANTAWAFAKARHYDSALFGRLASQLAAKNRDDTLSVGEISMAMYALAETGHQSPVLFREVCVPTTRPPLLPPRPLSQAPSLLPWASVCERLHSLASLPLSVCPPKAATAVSFSLPRSAQQFPCLPLRQFGRKLTARAGELSTGEQAMVLRSCAKARRSPDGLFDELGKRIAVVWTSARTQELSMAAWALAKASHRSPDVYEALADAFLIRAQEFSPKVDPVPKVSLLASFLALLSASGAPWLPAFHGVPLGSTLFLPNPEVQWLQPNP